MLDKLPELVRTFVRPVTTLVLLGVASVMVLYGQGSAIPEWYRDLTLMAIAFWFGSRVNGHS